MNSSLPSNGTLVLGFFERCSTYHLGPLSWSCFCLLSFLCGAPVSVKALWEIHQRHKQKVTNDFFLLNLSFMNLTFVIFTPFIVLNYMVWHSSAFDWLTNYMYNVSLSGKPLFMACVCGDCYFAVVHPIMYRSSRESSLRKRMSVTIWLIAFCFALLVSFVNWRYMIPLIAVALFLAVPVITFCVYSILQAIRKPDPSGMGSNHLQKKKFIQTIITSSTVSLFAYLPPVIIFPLAEVVPKLSQERQCNLVYFGMCCSTLGSIFMPILYLYNANKLAAPKQCWRKLQAGLHSK